MKRIWLAVLAVLPMLWLAGCSDYPTEGSVELREVRERVTVNEVSGTIFGAKPGTIKAVQNLQADHRATRNLKDEAWDYVYSGAQGEKPSLTLAYEGVDGTELKAAVDFLIAAAQAEYDEEMAEYNGRNQELEAKKAELEAEVAQKSEAKAKFDAAVKKAQEALDQAQKRVDEAVAVYNKPFEAVGPELNALAETKGLKTAYNGNVIGRYRSIDFSKKSSQPKQCPPQRGYFSIDIRDVNGLCAYMQVPSEFKQAGLSDKAESIMSKHFKAMQKAKKALGEERSWGQKATGLYATLDNAKQNVSSTKKQVGKELGIDRHTMRRLELTGQQIQRIENELAERADPEFIASRISSLYSTPDEYRKAENAYFEAIEADLLTNKIERVSEIVKVTNDDIPNGSFEDIPDGLEAVIAMTDLVVTVRNRKDTVRSLEVLDLTDPKVQEADQLEVRVDRDNIDDISRKDDVERQNREMLERLGDYVRKLKA